MNKKLLSLFLAFVMSLGFAPDLNASQGPQGNWEAAMDNSLNFIRGTVTPHPVVGSVGGEWAILALARSGRLAADDPWLTGWFADLDRQLAEVDRLIVAGNDFQNPPSAGTFPSALRRWTDFQRVTIALSSLGLDASNFNGRNLTEVYAAFVPTNLRHALNVTSNVDTFALIALDVGQHIGDRDLFIQQLIDDQRADGTWSLNYSFPTSAFDLDITAMALQAIAPYYYQRDPRVTNAVNKALGWLRAQTFHNAESTAQMIVALTALGPQFADEAAYYVDWLLRWYDPATGGFRRPGITDPVNLMATEQAAYALVAYWRFVNGMTSLYDMRDAFDLAAGRQLPSANIAPTGNIEPQITPPGRTFADIENHANRRAIEALAAKGVISGRSDTVFDPNATMSRAEFAAVITRGLGLLERNITVFYDVPSDIWFAGFVGAAFYYEIVSGISETEFNPNGTITRQEAAVMVARAARLVGMDTNLNSVEILNILAKFGDYRSAADWALSALAFCYREEILDDYEFYILPMANITRAEIAEMLYRLFQL